MAFQVSEILLVLFLLATIIAIPCGLQLYLSTRKTKWFGYILPVASNTFASFFTIFTALNLIGDSVLEMLGMALLMFLVLNIPSVVFMAIYILCRKKYFPESEMSRMKSQDLDG